MLSCHVLFTGVSAGYRGEGQEENRGPQSGGGHEEHSGESLP